LEKESKCVHCGAGCGKTPVVSNGLFFCCHGCRTVYELLNDSKLHTYYKLEKNPGIRLDPGEADPRYEFLDKEEIAGKLILFNEGETVKVRFYVPVIHCISCIWLLEHLDKLHSGIRYSTVNFARKEVDITFNKGEISLRGVVELLASVHYVPDLSQSLPDQKPSRTGYKSLLYKLGVAGFVFINVMTYSLPAYFNGKPLEGKLGSLLGILSYVLTIPVVFYSGSDYYLSAYKNLKKNTINLDLPIAIGILVLFLVTSYEVISGAGPGYSDSLSGLIFFLLVGKWYQGKSYESLSFERNYKSWFPIAVTKINKQLEESILLEKIEPGDLLLIRNRELIPADSILVEGTGMIDYSFVTGESNPMLKTPGEFLYAGGRQLGGIIKVKVEKEVNQSHLTELWNQDKTSLKPADRLERITEKAGRNFTWIIIVIAVLGAVCWMWKGNLHLAAFVFTSVLIIACPCALALSVPFTFGNTMRIFGQHGLYIKNTHVIEKMAGINTIVFDKTGTLTHSGDFLTQYHGKPLTPEERNAIYSLARQSAHPLSMALTQYLNDGEYSDPLLFTEAEGRGVFGQFHGLTIRFGSDNYVAGIPEQPDVLASMVHLSINDVYAGYFSISNRYREGLAEVLAPLQEAFDLYLVSGDNDAERNNLLKYFPGDHLYFNRKPGEKAEFVRQLQDKGKMVLMTGDGLNDAGALMQSDVALTIANKAYQFSPASDAVLEAGKFGLLAAFIRFTRSATRIVYLSFVISLAYNIIGISIALTGKLSPVVAAILMPASSVSVVAFVAFATRLAGKMKIK
jgi:P-type Cu+ transporter